MYVEENYIDKTRNMDIGESGLYEPFTDDIGKLFREFQKLYGRCTSKVYVDNYEKRKHIGWAFEKKKKYTDTKETYIQETWISLHEDRPTVTTEYHYKEL